MAVCAARSRNEGGIVPTAAGGSRTGVVSATAAAARAPAPGIIVVRLRGKRQRGANHGSRSYQHEGRIQKDSTVVK